MIAFAWDAASGCFAKLAECGLTIAAQDVTAFFNRLVRAVADAPAEHWSPVAPSGREGVPARGCCELLLTDGEGGAWLVGVARGFEAPRVADEVVLVFDQEEREDLRSFFVDQLERTRLGFFGGGAHYRDWKRRRRDSESDLVIYIEEEGWRPNFPEAARVPVEVRRAPLIPPFDVSREGARARWGDPLGCFPSRGAHAGAVTMWESMALWFGEEGLCRRAQLGPGSGVLIDGLDVLSPSYRRAGRALCESVPDVIVGKRSAASISRGVKLVVSAKPWLRRRARYALVVSPQDLDVRAQALFPIARAVLPGGWREGLRLVRRWLRDFPYSVTHPPQTDLADIEGKLECGRWSEAVSLFIIDVNNMGLSVPEDDRAVVEGLCKRLGVEEGIDGSGLAAE